MRIPDNIIDQVRNATDIVDLVGAHVSLKRRGKNYVGLCPFHREKTPSFTVSPDKQMYHCFGCGKGGNVFTFLMELEKVGFGEAVRSLADRAGVIIPADQSSPREKQEFDELADACRFAGNLFFLQLVDSQEGAFALSYLRKRGFSEEASKTFGLGYSLNTWDGLYQVILKEKKDPDVFLKAGLLRQRDDGTFYDYFRGRLMFPILTPAGKVVGFGARKLYDDDQLGKYINSPETPLYNKSRILFGLSHTREAIRSQGYALVVEGYADLISLFQSGIQNVVASSGTALTGEQLMVLRRYTRRLVLLFDADSAGAAAMVRGIDTALELDFDVEVVSLPRGFDPDSYVKEHGPAALKSLIETASSFIDFKVRQLQEEGGFSSPERKAESIRAIVQSIARIKDELKRNLFVKDVAQRYDLYETVLFRELDRWLKRPPVREGERRMPRSVPRDQSEIAAEQSWTEGLSAAESDLVRLLLENREDVARYIFSNIRIDDLRNASVRAFASIVARRLEIGESLDVPALLHGIEDQEMINRITNLALTRYQLSKGWQDQEREIDEPDPMLLAKAAVLHIRRTQIENRLAENLRKMKTAEVGSDEARKHTEIHLELTRQLEEMKQSPAASE